jgi:hypothetical protein
MSAARYSMTDPAPLDAPAFEIVDHLPIARLGSSDRVFDHAIHRVASVIRVLVANGQPHLLVDAGDAGFGSPSLADRSRMVRLWADAAAGQLRIAVVAPPDFIDPERFGVVSARNFGLAAQVFESERAAVAWLRAEHAAERRRSAVLPRE